MIERKFLTVMAVFDAETQEKLTLMQKHLIENISSGTQTMGIPFHLTLGSYPTDELDNVIERIKRIAAVAKPFDIKLVGYNHFSNRVFFLEPDIPVELFALRKSFQCDYANGLEWVPHATLFCGEEHEVRRAREIAPDVSFPINAKIVGIELGEFFPPNNKFSITFEGKNG